MEKRVLVVLVAATAFFYWYSGRSERAFADAAEEIKGRAPFMVAPGVRMESAERRDKELLMNVTLTDEQPDAPFVQQQQTIHLLEKTLTASWCGHEAVRRALDDGFAVAAVASRADGSVLTKVRVAREECICAEQGGDVCVIRY